MGAGLQFPVLSSPPAWPHARILSTCAYHPPTCASRYHRPSRIATTASTAMRASPHRPWRIAGTAMRADTRTSAHRYAHAHTGMRTDTDTDTDSRTDTDTGSGEESTCVRTAVHERLP
eukprot:2091535-Rhodomonas_salina.1